MNKQELTIALAGALRVDNANASRLAGRFILLGKKYRKNLLRQVSGAPMAALLTKTEAEIKNLCDRLAIRYKIHEDVRGPILWLYLNNFGSECCVVEDGL